VLTSELASEALLAGEVEGRYLGLSTHSGTFFPSIFVYSARVTGQRFMESTIHRSHSLVVFRHSSDERNPTDVTGRPVPVEAPGGCQSRDPDPGYAAPDSAVIVTAEPEPDT
jgi:hypothetical protein